MSILTSLQATERATFIIELSYAKSKISYKYCQLQIRCGPPFASRNRDPHTLSGLTQDIQTGSSIPGGNRPGVKKTMVPRTMGETILRRWHRLMGLPRQSPPSWYRDRLREELQERRAAANGGRRLGVLSETADVFFTLSRARYDGAPARALPRFAFRRHAAVYAYMLAKFTSRWAFYRVLAFLCRRPCPCPGGARADRARHRHEPVREVVNPSRDRKLDEVASRHHIDPARFRRVGRRLRWVWPLLP